MYINSTGVSGIRLRFNARDIDGSSDNAAQSIAVQYRIGTSGSFINVPAGYIADASTGPSLATLVTPVDVTLPGAADNQAQLQIRIITTNAAGNDEWIGIDDIEVSTGGTATNAINTGSVTTTPFCLDASNPATGSVAYAATGTYNTTFTAYLSDASGSFAAPLNVGTASVNGTDPAGTINITLPAGTASGTGYRIRVDASAPAVTGTESAAFEIINGAKNVTNVSAAPGNAQAIINWTNPTACFDEVMIVAKASSSITGTPTGDGSAYTGSTTFGAGDPFDGGFVVYKGITSPQTITGLTNGTTYYVRVFSRRGTNWSAGVEVQVTPGIQPNPGDIVINQLSPDYGGASDEYVELVNTTNNTYDLSGLALRYQSAGGSPGGAGGSLSGMLMGKKFWLLSPNATVTVGQTNNLARDGAITAGFAGAAGQIALVRISDNVIIDAVGYGTITTPNYTETAAASAPPADGGIRRVTDGADTDNNSVDFATVDNGSIYLRNSLGESLPIRFSALKAVQKENSILLSWSNATEENVTNYSVERSSNGRSFTAIGTISARNNNSSRVDYSFIDAAPLSGDNFYRIKALETTGKTVYTNIVRINTVKKGIELVLYPNPVLNEMSLQFSNLPAGNYTLRIINTGGQVVGSRIYIHGGGSVTESLPVNSLAKGVYTLQVSGAVNLQKQFVKQ